MQRPSLQTILPFFWDMPTHKLPAAIAVGLHMQSRNLIKFMDGLYERHDTYTTLTPGVLQDEIRALDVAILTMLAEIRPGKCIDE